MKIIQINSVYKKGSTGKITFDIHKYLLESGVESIVCYGRGVKYAEKNVYKFCPEWYSKLNNIFSRITGVLYGGCFFSTKKLFSVIKKEKPDIVHIQCVNEHFVNVYKLIAWLKKNKVKTVLTLHAEFMFTANCGHALDCNRWKLGCGNCLRFREETKSLLFDRTAYSWKKMREAFNGFDKNLVIVSVSPWLMNRAKQSPIFCNCNHKVVFNGLDTSIFHRYESLDNRDVSWISLNHKIVFHATAYFNTNVNNFKGGYYVFELAKRMKDVDFVVAGPVSDVVENAPSNLHILGNICDQKRLAAWYSYADLTIITSKKETFSMVCAESFVCGTPVVGFEAGGPESICIPEYSCFVHYGDIDSLEMKVREFLNFKWNKSDISQKGEKIYSRQNMAENYKSIYEFLCQ